LRTRRPTALLFLSAALLALPSPSRSQPPADPEAIRSLIQSSSLSVALAFVERDESRTIEDAVALCEIPAPPFAEDRRAAAFRDRLAGLGLRDARIDGEGNVLALRPGSGETPLVVLSAHLDTVFPKGTDVTVRREGNRLYAPGIGDDSAGLATLLGVIRALEAADIRTRGSLLIVGTVGEEGLGDLRGVKHLFTKGSYAGRIDHFISVDGASPDRLTYRALGSLRYRVTFSGPGGHSWQDFGMSNPIHALGRAIDGIAKMEFLRSEHVSFNVGRIGGGTSVNSIAHDAWMEVDLRSTDREALQRAEGKLRTVVNHALVGERRFGFRKHKPLRVKVETIGDRPSGGLSEGEPIVRTADSVLRALGSDPYHTPATSSDANVPISMGISALTVGTGGESDGAHSPGEWLDTTGFSQGVKQALTLAVMLAGLEEGGARGVD
jgi:tripeptide aminopeptidase